MIEFLILSTALVVVVVFLSRRGAPRVARPRVGMALAATGFFSGVLLEALPFSPVAGPFTIRTLFAGLIGLFGGRLLGRAVTAWARGYRDEDLGATADEARLVHPLIAVGLILTGFVVIHEVAATRHLMLETARSISHGRDGVLEGAEELRLPAPEGGDHAVLLVHGFLGSRADFGDLPQALHEAGLGVHALRLPAHGTTPADLGRLRSENLLAAVRSAYDELAKDHARVSVVGFSVGGALAALLTEDRQVHRLVLANPYAGEIATPWFSPLSTDDMIRIAPRLLRHVLRPPGLNRVNRPEGRGRLITYYTVPVAAAAESQRIGGMLADAEIGKVRPGRTLLLFSRSDHTLPSDVGRAFFDGRFGDGVEEIVFEESDHVLFLDHDAPEATRRVIETLTR